VKAGVILQSESASERKILEMGTTYLQDLGKVDQLTITEHLGEEVKQAIAGVVGTIQVLIPLSGIVDIALLRGKLEKSLAKVEGELNSLLNRLNKPDFVNKAKPDVVQKAQEALAEAQKQGSILRDRLKRLE
jgi:valyl-tRNA synthetase